MEITSNWLVKKGVKRKAMKDNRRELFSALTQDSIYKNKLSLKQLVSDLNASSINAQALKELKKKKFYKTNKTF